MQHRNVRHWQTLIWWREQKNGLVGRCFFVFKMCQKFKNASDQLECYQDDREDRPDDNALSIKRAR